MKTTFYVNLGFIKHKLYYFYCNHKNILCTHLHLNKYILLIHEKKKIRMFLFS